MLPFEWLSLIFIFLVGHWLAVHDGFCRTLEHQLCFCNDAQILYNTKKHGLAVDLVHGLFIQDAKVEKNQESTDAYQRFVKKYERINHQADAMQKIPYVEFIIKNIHKVGTLFAIMGSDAFDMLGGLTAKTVHQADRFCHTLQCMPELMVVFLQTYYNKHAKMIHKKPKLWQMILICASVQSQFETLSTEELVEHYEQLATQEAEKFYRGISHQLLRSMFAQQEHEIEIDIEQDVDLVEVFKRIPPDYFAKLVKSSQSMIGDEYGHIFNLMLARDCVPKLGTIYDLLHDEKQEDYVGAALARHNNYIRGRLVENGIDPRQALHYRRRYDFYYVNQDSQSTDLVQLQNQVLFNYLQQMMMVLKGMNPGDTVGLIHQIGSIEKSYAALEKQVGHNGTVPLHKSSNKIIFAKIMRNLTAIKHKLEHGECKLAAPVRRRFEEFQNHLTDVSAYLNQAKPAKRSKHKSQSHHFRVEFVDKNEPSVFFLGDEVGCCLATDGGQFSAIVQRRMDDAMQFLVVRDQETGHPAALMWLYLSENENGEIELRMNFPEVNVRYATDETLRQALLFSMCQFCEQYVRDNPNIKGFLLNPVSYGWNVQDLKDLPVQHQKRSFDKLGGPFVSHLEPGEYAHLDAGEKRQAKQYTQQKYYLVSLNSDKFHRYNSAHVPKRVKDKFRSVYEVASEFLQSEVSKVLVRDFRQGLLSQPEFRRLRYVVSHYGVVDSVWNKLSSLSQLQLENMLRPFCDTDGDYGRLIAQVRHDSRFGVKESNQSGCQSPNTLFFSHSHTMRKLHEDWLIENRHQSPELQEAYDCRFGLVLRNN